MKRKISTATVTGTRWQVLGDLELTAGSNIDPIVNNWLSLILSRLKLQQDFFDKVLKSAEEAASRAMRAEGVRKFKHLHLHIFVLADHNQNDWNWGFYRIEKIKRAAGKSNPDHAIEFYLYQE